MTRIYACLAVLLALGNSASADVDPNAISITAFDPDNAVAPESVVEGPGIKVGEGTVLHPVFGLETGVVSNVFYQDLDPAAAGLLRLMAQVGAGSLSSARLTPASADDNNAQNNLGSFDYKASLRASYDFLLSGNDTVTSTGGLGVGALFRGMANPLGRWSLGFEENFTRLIRAANFETNLNTNRDINALSVNLLYHSPESAFGGYAYYTNTIDVFEANIVEFADRLQHKFGIHPQWKAFPNTTVFVDASMGVYSGVGSASLKETSYPLAAVAGLNTLLSLKTTFNLQAGYVNGFYSAGPSYSAPTVGAAVGYRYSPLGRISLAYDWVYQDSVNSNYYRDHVVRLSVQQLVNPFIIMVQPEVHFREYNGIDTIVMGAQPTRDDMIFSLVAGAHYQLRNWAAATLDYRFTDVSTDYRYPAMMGAVDNPSYVRHELLLGVRVAL